MEKGRKRKITTKMGKNKKIPLDSDDESELGFSLLEEVASHASDAALGDEGSLDSSVLLLVLLGLLDGKGSGGSALLAEGELLGDELSVASLEALLDLGNRLRNDLTEKSIYENSLLC